MLLRSLLPASFGLVVLTAACSSTEPAGDESNAEGALSGCHGQASHSVPEDGQMVLTTFGDPRENQPLACGGSSRNGTWWYAASKSRYGCGTHVKVEANGKCAVVQTDDFGPDVCVENAVGKPILDTSPLVSKHLFGRNSAGWSDRLKIKVTKVDRATPLGPCSGAVAGGDGGGAPNGNDGGGPGGPGGGNDGGGPNGVSCSNDGNCNTGNDGSGMICDRAQGVCVPGCHGNAQCPGNTSCGADSQCH